MPSLILGAVCLAAPLLQKSKDSGCPLNLGWCRGSSRHWKSVIDLKVVVSRVVCQGQMKLAQTSPEDEASVSLLFLKVCLENILHVPISQTEKAPQVAVIDGHCGITQGAEIKSWRLVFWPF